MTNSPAIEKLSEYVPAQLEEANLGLSPNAVGVLPLIGPFCDTGLIYGNIQRRVIIDDSLTFLASPSEQAVRLMANAMRDITIRQHIATSVRHTISQAVIEMEREDFCSSLFVCCVVFVARKINWRAEKVRIY